MLLEWKSALLISGLVVGGLIAPILRLLLPHHLLERILLWSRLLYIISLTVFIFENKFQVSRKPWTSKLGKQLDKFNKRANWQPKVIKCRRLLSACWPSRLLTLRTGKVPYLPPEIWGKILDFAIHVPFVLDTSCDATNFHQFASSQRYLPDASVQSYRLIESRRKTLRLVCNTWKELLDRRQQRWLFEGSGMFEGRLNRLERIDISLSMRFVLSRRFRQVRRDIYSILNVPKELSSLANICIEDIMYQSDSSRKAVLHLFSQLSQISNLQAFTYTNYFEAIFTTQELQTYFSSITCLHITAIELCGSLHLEKLEVLYLDIGTCYIGQWSFPSLRYLAVNRGGIAFLYHSDAGEQGPISSSSLHGLRSLLFFDVSLAITITEKFWTIYPQLECIGGFLGGFTILDSPPPDHPLCQITNIGPEVDHWIIQTHLASLPVSLPNLRRIHMPFRRQKHFFLEHEKTWSRLVQEHRQKGIVWLDRDGVEIRYKRVLIQVQAGPILQPVTWLAAYLHCNVDLGFCIGTGSLRMMFPFYQSIVFRLSLMCLVACWITVFTTTRFISPRYKWVCEG
ncbi:hypothetical protein CPB86DRAFT_871823 [Serendipita vermifera]|nr:hypothetical protein CPB86DRAFT_871823 [Serendipita vermifera]